MLSSRVPHLLADAGEALDQQLVVVRNLHQLGGAVAVVCALVGLGLQDRVRTTATAFTGWATADSCSVKRAPATELVLLLLR
jgi:hypothetical protein